MSEVKTDKLSPRTGSGTVTLGTSGDTFSIPSGVTLSNSGTATGFGGNNTPAFQANFTTSQTLSDNVWTKMQANTEDFDTDSAYDNSTNYRFTVPSGEGGKYFLYSRMTIISSGGSSYILGEQFMQIRVNSETDTTARFFLQEKDYAGGYYKTLTLLGITDLAAADTVEFYAKSNVTNGYNSYIANDMRESVVGGYKMIGL
jgi:hypothetical protein